MGAWVIASLFLLNLITIEARSVAIENAVGDSYQRMLEYQEPAGLAYTAKGMVVAAQPQSASPLNDQRLLTSSTNYQAFPVTSYHYGYGPRYTAPPTYHNRQYEEDHSAESTKDDEFGNHEQFLGSLHGFTHYKTSNSFNLEGPHQLETINTRSYHKEVEPFDTSSFSHDEHKADEEHAEVHYHQHKHVHKHNHKQEHVHKHKDEHKHQHGHKHEHKGHHEHQHHSQHKHEHQQKHRHEHKGEHEHKHQHGHHHNHHQEHKHEHKHHQEHKHIGQHAHKHSHHSDHKHEHHQDHKHDHHHEHGHHGEHKHKHHSDEHHKHQHQHKEESKHQHKHQHGHKHEHKSSGHHHGR